MDRYINRYIYLYINTKCMIYLIYRQNSKTEVYSSSMESLLWKILRMYAFFFFFLMYFTAQRHKVYFFYDQRLNKSLLKQNILTPGFYKKFIALSYIRFFVFTFSGYISMSSILILSNGIMASYLLYRRLALYVYIYVYIYGYAVVVYCNLTAWYKLQIKHRFNELRIMLYIHFIGVRT